MFIVSENWQYEDDKKSVVEKISIRIFDTKNKVTYNVTLESKFKDTKSTAVFFVIDSEVYDFIAFDPKDENFILRLYTSFKKWIDEVFVKNIDTARVLDINQAITDVINDA